MDDKEFSEGIGFKKQGRYGSVPVPKAELEADLIIKGFHFNATPDDDELERLLDGSWLDASPVQPDSSDGS